MKINESGVFQLSSLPLNQTQALSLTHQQNWLWSSFRELIRKNFYESLKEYTPPPTLEISGELSHKRNAEFDHYYLLEAQLRAQYPAQCVRCLKIFSLHIDHPLNACFIAADLSEEPHFRDQLQVFAMGREWDLYYFEPAGLSVSEYVADQLLELAVAYPLHDPACRGLCQECGIDLNHSSCPHQSL